MPEVLIILTSEIVAAHASKNNIAIGDVSGLISTSRSVLSPLGNDAGAAEEVRNPAVSIRSSIKKENLVFLDCDRKTKMLKPHLSQNTD